MISILKKYAMIWILVFLLIILVVLKLIYRESDSESVSSDMSISITPTLTPSVINDQIEDDGVIEPTPVSDEQQKILDLMADLRKKLPYTSDDFNLAFDYKNLNFIVSLKEMNGTVFWNWIENNGYSGIPTEYFILLEKDY